MKKNIGNLDKLIRVLIAFSIGCLYYFQMIKGLQATLLLFIALHLAISALLNFSFIYRILGINTDVKK